MRALALVLGALVAAAPAAARAGVVVGHGVPFTAAELEDAIVARSDGAAAPDVEVSAAGGERLRLVTDGGTWQVAVGDARGPSAARLVALHVVAAAEPAVVAPPTLAAGAPSVAAPVPDRPATRSWWVTAGTGATRGTDANDLTALAVAVEVGTGRGPWLAGVEVSLHGTTASDAGAGMPVRTTLTQVRATAGVRRGGFELVGGPLAGLLFLDNVPGRRSAAMFGIGGAARWRRSLGGPWTLQLGAGVDGYRHRIVVSTGAQPIASTPRAAVGVMLGLSRVLEP